MLPNKLISQNPGGIMLFLALSEAIHCQTKRRPKIKLPLQPMIFQAFTSTAASCKIAKRDCMGSLSHRIFFAASWAVERCLPGAAGRGRRSERCSVGNDAKKNRRMGNPGAGYVFFRSYFIFYRHDSVGIISNLLPLPLYARNVFLHWRHARNDKKAQESAKKEDSLVD